LPDKALVDRLSSPVSWLREAFWRHSRLIAFAAIALAAATFLGSLGWPQPRRTLELCVLLFAAILTSAVGIRTREDRATMRPSFVVEFTTMLLFGPSAAMLLGALGAVARGLADPERSHPVRRIVVNGATVAASLQAAGSAHYALGGALGHFVWPWQSVPIAAAVAAYYVVQALAAALLVPLIARERIDRSWPQRLLPDCPSYFIGASFAVACVEMIDHRLWEVLLVASLPLYLVYRTYRSQVIWIETEQRRREVRDALEQGMSVVDDDGRVTVWNDVLEQILGCTRERAIGRTLTAAVPALSRTELPHAAAEVLKARTARSISHLSVSTPAGSRVLQVKMLPVSGGVTLLWHDITPRLQAERALARNEERLALAAEGANDGLWEWDLRTQELYCSGRWRAMIGLPASAAIGRPEEWFNRVHPEDIGLLKEALEAHLTEKTDHLQCEHRIRHEDGTYRRYLCRGVAVRNAARRTARIAGSLTDTDRAIAQDRVRAAGFLDPLTGLCNRAVFVEGLGRRLDEFKHRPSTGRFAALYLDLDRFKVVNDSLGHLVGDELLAAVSRRLESCLRQGDVLARLGGDEFAILLNGLADDQQANAIAFRIQEALRAPFLIGGREVFTSASIGIAFGLGHYGNPDDIMRDADTAMYHAKSRGKARHEIFDADMHARTRDRLGLESDLRRAISAHDFEVHYQPIVSLSSRMCVGFESLVRWTRNGESISPATFVPIAEELGLIEPLGTWVLQEACRRFADWQRRFPSAGLDCITVNVSSRQLMQQNFLYLVEQAVHTARLRPCDLRLEITETALMDSPAVAAQLLSELRKYGVKIYLDDFGTGYSSLSHLHKLPVDALKIDRSFVRSLLLSDRPAIVESILALARTLNTSVVAEGIESEVQARELQRLGCTHAQGYLFSRPLAPGAVEELLASNQPLGRKPVQAAAANGPFHPPAPAEWPQSSPAPVIAPDAAPCLAGQVATARRA
jgi:diguanylate cyclase (GGDEF)-like protein/PAS domain S-box-containing protein